MNDEGKTHGLTDDEIVTLRSRERRSFLKSVGVAVLGAAAAVMGSRAASASDTKPNNDSDATRNADLKAHDSDSKDAGSDNDQSRLRDYKKSSDRD